MFRTRPGDDNTRLTVASNTDNTASLTATRTTTCGCPQHARNLPNLYQRSKALILSGYSVWVHSGSLGIVPSLARYQWLMTIELSRSLPMCILLGFSL